ncbi:MAG: hypothetical protein J7L61_00605 [Thermoplasmata archaeon]|nr:hypothetical protein [Thermoplasmata archaeon]
MLFVTVGSTYFDRLIREVDRLAGENRLPGVLGDEVVAQIGSGKYEPKHIRFFRYAPSLQEYFERADLVISHAAAGTLFPLLNMGKRVVAVTNPRLRIYTEGDMIEVESRVRGRMRIEYRQQELPMKLEEEGYLVWCPRVEELEEAIEKALSADFKRYTPPPCTIREHVERLLG